LQAIRAVLERAGLGVDISRDIRVARWEKLAALAGTGGVMALTRMPAGPLRACPETRALIQGVLEGAVTVGQAAGIPVSDDYIRRQMALLDDAPPESHGPL